ncbi:MAG TPA: hypothetical protein VGB07_37180 [Blastocatellia bacterium]
MTKRTVVRKPTTSRTSVSCKARSQGTGAIISNENFRLGARLFRLDRSSFVGHDAAFFVAAAAWESCTA